MKHVTILPLHDAAIHSIDSTYQLFSRVNDFMRYKGNPPCFDVVIAGTDNVTALSGGIYQISAHETISHIDRTDIIVVPLLCGDFEKAIALNQPYAEWLIAQRQHAEIACLCSGSFFLASTGLLNGRKCAVHWAALHEFQRRFPKVEAVGDRIITDEDGIYTSAGNFSYLNLLLYIIEKHTGKETAVLASKMFQIEMGRISQAPFTILIPQKKHSDKEVHAVQEWIESHPAEVFTVDFLCEKFAVARRTFERRFRRVTGNSIVEYAQRIKVELAKRMLETGRKTVNEIIYDTGYNDIDAFRKLFRKYTSMTPLEYRKKFSVGI